MRIVGIQCDACTKQVLNGDHYATPEFPPEWFTVFHGSMIGKEGYHFCSAPCLKEWSEKLLLAAIPQEVML